MLPNSHYYTLKRDKTRTMIKIKNLKKKYFFKFNGKSSLKIDS